MQGSGRLWLFASLLALWVSSITASSSVIHLHKKKLNVQSERSNIMENYNSGEFRKRSVIWKDSVQLIIHLTDVSFLNQVTQVCQTDKVQYVPENSYVILCPIDSIPTISAFHFVDYFDRFSPEYKIPANPIKGEERSGKSIYTLTLAPGSGNTEEEINNIVSILESELSSLGLVVLERSFDLLVLGVNSKYSNLFLQTVSEYDFCHFIEANTRIKLNNKEARGITMTGDIANYYPETVMNITGKGVTVGVTDSGLDLKHCYFYDPVFTLQDLFCYPSDLTTPQCLTPSTHRKVAGYFAFTDAVDKSGHGTHTSGTVAGSPFTTTASVEAATYIGVAKDAKIAFVDIEYATNSTLNIPSLLATVFPFQKRMGSTISSNSFSAVVDDGVYGTRAVEIDSFQFSNPDFLVIFAAGNAGQAYGSASSYGNNKNGISVGSVEKLPSVKVSVTSGAGLSPEQRIKPDLVAPGVNIFSASFKSSTIIPSCTSTGQTAKRSGTSMAAPNVAGAAALVTQYFKDGYVCNKQESCKVPNPSGALIKAALISSAQHFFETWYKGPGIEYTGYGRVDLSDVFDYTGDKLVFFDKVPITLGSDFVTSVFPSGKGALNVVLTWYEPAASAAASSVVINNLDLIVTSPSGKVYYGNEYLGIYSQQRDDKNTVERVLIPQIDIEAGDYIVTVNAVAINQASPLQFSLVINKESRSECKRCGKMRLSGGGKEGVVELFKGGQWWNVCGATVDNNFAHTVCEHLGFPKSGNHILFRNSKYGPGSLSIWDRNISCSETGFYDCSFGKESVGACSHLNDISVSCDCPAPHVWDGSNCIISYCENGAKTFSTGPTNIPIPENFFAVNSILVVSGLPTPNTNYSIVVKTSLNHPRNSDLDIYLRSPNTGRYISAQKGLNFGYSFNGATIRDDAPDRIKYYRFISDGPLKAIAPQDTFASLLTATTNLNGNWTLSVYDYGIDNGQTGFFQGWSISFLNECSCVRGKCDVLSCNSCDCSRTGYTGKRCDIDINECDLGVCGNNAKCTNTEGSYLCGCLPGYQGDGFICSDVDECSTNNGYCDINAKCTNTEGSRTCACNPGYFGDGLTCTDVDECLTNNGGCNTNAKCTNTEGSRTCTCNSGYFGDGLTCDDVDECLVDNGGCNTNAKCTNSIGSRTCTCNPGYFGDGLTCNDIDECLTNNGGCNTNAKCTNSIGSRTCTCNSGFIGDGLTCNDVDECLTNNGGCNTNAKCTNSIGSRTCTCNPGFIGDGLTCNDIDECLTNNGGCNTNAKCTNTVGSRTCTCNKGFTGNGITTCNIAQTIALFEFNGNTEDSSSSGFSLSTTSQTFSSFYQRGSPSNQAIRLNGNSPLTLSNVPLSAKFTIHLLFNGNPFSALFDLITILPTDSSPRSQALLVVSGDSFGRIKWTKTNSPLGQSQKVIGVGVTHSLVVTVRDGQVATWVDDTRLGKYSFSFNGGNSFAISIGKNFSGFIDHFAVYSYPTYITNSLNDNTQCINSCPPGKVCYNLSYGPVCA